MCFGDFVKSAKKRVCWLSLCTFKQSSLPHIKNCPRLDEKWHFFGLASGWNSDKFLSLLFVLFVVYPHIQLRWFWMSICFGYFVKRTKEGDSRISFVFEVFSNVSPWLTSRIATVRTSSFPLFVVLFLRAPSNINILQILASVLFG